jgi:hypothetical protein
MVTNFILKVETIGGTHIYDAIDEAISLSKLLGIGIETDFNGFRLLAFPNTTGFDLRDEYSKWELKNV